MKQTIKYSTIILFMVTVISCTEKSEKQYMHDFSGAWEILSVEKFVRNTDGGYDGGTTIEDAGYVYLWDMGDDLGHYNNCNMEIDTTAHSEALFHLLWNYGPYASGYWYADDERRLTVWCYLPDAQAYNYSTFTVDKKGKNKMEWTYYYNTNDSTGYKSPYLDPTHKEVYTVKRKTH